MIPITRPAIDEQEVEAVAAVLRSGYLVQGPRVAAFERLVAERCGVSHALAVSNCTTALQASLLAVGVGPGDLVIVAPFSWIATANVIELCGATPVFVDVDPASFNLSPSLLRERLTSLKLTGELGRVRAVMPVHTFGNPLGIDEVVAIASQFGLPVIEDAACALGAEVNGSPAGSLGTAGCFSFHPRKIITTGEGGMVITDSEEVARFVRAYRNHGQETVDGLSAFVMPGSNLRMTEMQGAMGEVQMSKLTDLTTARAQLAARYDALIEPLGVVPQRRGDGAAVQSYVVVLPEGVDAQDVIARVRAQGVEVTIGTNAIPFEKIYTERYRLLPDELPATSMLRRRSMTLPLFPGMADEQQDMTIDVLKRSL